MSTGSKNLVSGNALCGLKLVNFIETVSIFPSESQYKYQNQGGARHPRELFSPFFTTTNISAYDLVPGDHALGI